MTDAPVRTLKKKVSSKWCDMSFFLIYGEKKQYIFNLTILKKLFKRLKDNLTI